MNDQAVGQSFGVWIRHDIVILVVVASQHQRSLGKAFARAAGSPRTCLKEEATAPPVGGVLQRVHRRVPQPPGPVAEVPEGRRRLHGEVRAVDNVVEARGDAVEEAVAVAGHLADPGGDGEEPGVPSGVAGAVPAADVGEGLPVAGAAGEEVGEEAGGGVDLRGGVPGGIVLRGCSLVATRGGGLHGGVLGVAISGARDRGVGFGEGDRQSCRPWQAVAAGRCEDGELGEGHAAR